MPLTESTLSLDTSLVFNYASRFVRNHQQYYEADYAGAELLKIPAGVSLKQAYLAQCDSSQLPHAPEQKLLSQTPEEDHAMWRSLPADIQRRWWGYSLHQQV